MCHNKAFRKERKIIILIFAPFFETKSCKTVVAIGLK